MRYGLRYFILFALVISLLWGALLQNIRYAQTGHSADWCLVNGDESVANYLLDIENGQIVYFNKPAQRNRAIYTEYQYSGSPNPRYRLDTGDFQHWKTSSEAWIVDKDTHKKVLLHKVKRGGNYLIDWSADSTYLAMGKNDWTNRTYTDLLIFKTDGTFQQKITGNIKVFKWSPDNTTLAFVSVDLNTNEYQLHFWEATTRQITNHLIYPTTELTWSPDGKYLIYRNPIFLEHPDYSSNFIFLNRQAEIVYSYPIVGTIYWLAFKWSLDRRYLLLDYSLNVNTSQKGYYLDLIDIENTTFRPLLQTITLPSFFERVAQWGETGVGFADMEGSQVVWKAYYPDLGEFRTLATITERPLFIYDLHKSVGIFRFNDHVFAMSADKANPVTLHDGTIPIINDKSLFRSSPNLEVSRINNEEVVIQIPYYANQRTYFKYLHFDGTFDVQSHTLEFDFPILLEVWGGYIKGIDGQGYYHNQFYDANKITWSLTTKQSFEIIEWGRKYLFYFLDGSGYLYEFSTQKTIPLPSHISHGGFLFDFIDKELLALVAYPLTLYDGKNFLKFEHIHYVHSLQWTPDGSFLVVSYGNLDNKIFTSVFNTQGEEISRFRDITMGFPAVGAPWSIFLKCSEFTTIPQRGRLSAQNFKLEK